MEAQKLTAALLKPRQLPVVTGERREEAAPKRLLSAPASCGAASPLSFCALCFIQGRQRLPLPLAFAQPLRPRMHKSHKLHPKKINKKIKLVLIQALRERNVLLTPDKSTEPKTPWKPAGHSPERAGGHGRGPQRRARKKGLFFQCRPVYEVRNGFRAAAANSFTSLYFHLLPF